MNKLKKVTLTLAAVLMGCSSKFEDICTLQNDCLGGNDADLDACIADAEFEEERASIYGCEEDFDSYFTCVEDSADCDDDVFTVDEDCEEDLHDLHDCIDDASKLD